MSRLPPEQACILQYTTNCCCSCLYPHRQPSQRIRNPSRPSRIPVLAPLSPWLQSPTAPSPRSMQRPSQMWTDTPCLQYGWATAPIPFCGYTTTHHSTWQASRYAFWVCSHSYDEETHCFNEQGVSRLLRWHWQRGHWGNYLDCLQVVCKGKGSAHMGQYGAVYVFHPASQRVAVL